MTAPDEWRFLETDAARVEARLVHTPTRIAFDDPEGALSAIRFGSEHPEYVFLHGAGLNAHTFDPTIIRMGVPALSIDLPGHGHSAWRDDAQYHAGALAGSITRMLAQTLTQKTTLVGQSLGGLTALEVATRIPQLISHVVLIDITPGVQTTAGASNVREFITGQREFQSIDEIIDRAIAFGIGSDRDSLRRGVELNTRVRSDGVIEFRHHLAHLNELPVGPDANSLWHKASELLAEDVRLSLIVGSDGIVTAHERERWRELVRGEKPLVVEGGHNVQEHNPIGLAEALRER